MPASILLDSSLSNSSMMFAQSMSGMFMRSPKDTELAMSTSDMIHENSFTVRNTAMVDATEAKLTATPYWQGEAFTFYMDPSLYLKLDNRTASGSLSSMSPMQPQLEKKAERPTMKKISSEDLIPECSENTYRQSPRCETPQKAKPMATPPTLLRGAAYKAHLKRCQQRLQAKRPSAALLEDGGASSVVVVAPTAADDFSTISASIVKMSAQRAKKVKAASSAAAPFEQPECMMPTLQIVAAKTTAAAKFQQPECMMPTLRFG